MVDSASSQRRTGPGRRGEPFLDLGEPLRGDERDVGGDGVEARFPEL